MAKQTRKPNKRRLLMIACVAMLAYIGMLFIQQESQLHAIDQRKLELQQQIEQVRAEGQSYRNTLEKVESDNYVEQEARDKLGLIKDGELQFYVKPKD